MTGEGTVADDSGWENSRLVVRGVEVVTDDIGVRLWINLGASGVGTGEVRGAGVVIPFSGAEQLVADDVVGGLDAPSWEAEGADNEVDDTH